MSTPVDLCNPSTIRNKSWTYDQYYVGSTDKNRSRYGLGENHWSGPESLEWYSGRFVGDAMHVEGTYHWRHRGADDVAATYEGSLYCNQLHGYGTMSYSDGRTYNGLFYDNVRWGPGVEHHASAHADVGLWRGTQLIRLAWRPATPSIAPDLINARNGLAALEPHRIKLMHTQYPILEDNTALQLLQLYRMDTETAMQRCGKLYPRCCADLKSPLFDFKTFDDVYYKNKLTLSEMVNISKMEENEGIDKNITQEPDVYYVWNNNAIIINMMQHSYAHEGQRKAFNIKLESILSGQRKQNSPPGKHELNCRSLLMASYLGQAEDVARLVNECHVNPNVSDSQGVTAIMYATYGDQAEVIHFLKEAGGDVNSYNDSCCTPLGVALMRYVCTQRAVSASDMAQALIPNAPPSLPTSLAQKPTEWYIVREVVTPIIAGVLARVPSKTIRNISVRKIKSLQSMKEQTLPKKKVEEFPKGSLSNINSNDDSLQDNNNIYTKINKTFNDKIIEVYSTKIDSNPVTYIFENNDLTKEIYVIDEDPKKALDKVPKKIMSKNFIKDVINTSREILFKDSEKEMTVDRAEKLKLDTLTKIMGTILQLLSDGAKPQLVKFPQSALLYAVIAGCPDLIRQLVKHGADVNEKYANIFSYSPLDVAVSRPYTHETLAVIQALLECGANTNDGLTYTLGDTKYSKNGSSQPTLLHATLSRKVDNHLEEQIRMQVLDLLLDYNCNPTTQFKGRSAIDMAMGKNLDLFNVLIKNPRVNLNCIVNDARQSPLMKMFNFPFFKTVGIVERLQTLENLLSYGADPLISCYNEEETYGNIFVWARKTLNELENTRTKQSASTVGKLDTKAKKMEKSKKEEKLSTKSLAVDDVEDYRHAVELTSECARFKHIQWLQEKHIMNLSKTVDKFSHRPWVTIIDECKNQMSIGLWVSPQKCLEICKTRCGGYENKEKNSRTLKVILCIVIFIKWKYFEGNNAYIGLKITAALKDNIEADANHLLKQQKRNQVLNISKLDSKRLDAKFEVDDDKFNVCFECSLPLNDIKIECCFCKIISFCNLDCIKINVERPNCHPCSVSMKLKYFKDVDVDENNT